MSLPEELLPRFDEVLKKTGLLRFREPLLNLSQIKYGLDPCKKKGSLGSSKFGGPPELPAGVNWPRTEEGYLVFVGQINLSELPKLDNVFPRQGLLSFFIGTDEPARDFENRVLYFSKPEKLHRLKPPKTDDYVPGCMQDGVSRIFKEAWLKVSTSLCLTSRYPEIEGISDEKFSNFREEAEGSDTSFVLGPTSSCVGESGLDAAIIHAGMKKHLYSVRTERIYQERIDEAIKDNPEYAKTLIKNQASHTKFCRALPKLTKEALNWKNLLVLDSHPETEMCWWDAGTLHFLAHSDSIKKCSFDATYTAIESS